MNYYSSFRMLRAKFLVAFSQMALALSLFPVASLARGQNKPCVPSSCGSLNITYPFRLDTDPSKCGVPLPQYVLVCENNHTTFPTNYGKFFVEEISYLYKKSRLVDASLNQNMCSIPHSSFIDDGFCDISASFDYRSTMYVLNCNAPVNSSLYVDASACTNSSSSLYTYYFAFNTKTQLSDFNESCTVAAQFPFLFDFNITGLSASDIYNKVLKGFEYDWSFVYYDLDLCIEENTLVKILKSVEFALDNYLDSFVFYLLGGPHVKFNSNFPSTRTYVKCLTTTGALIFARSLLGISILLVIVVHKLRRRHLSSDDIIEEFLQKQNNFMPIRYTYSEIKKITRGFKDKLGQGGYGSVFKGKLRSGHFVAIKLLGSSKANGQDFISEVATLGRIHHANVMQLVGFCVEGSKQALVYDFMPNGSLDKIIFSRESNTSLSWQKMFDIAIGVARGVEYLHRGCEMQILHFDIKPHNILLDENFNPKVSDFGLARLYPVDDSVVSLTAARGTFGYMAPELVFKNIGGVSNKADVYSFGMLLMEMVGRRRNINAFADQLSQIYFPTWIYERFDQGKDIELGDITDIEKNLVRKIVIVALWCIQMKPAIRPSMRKVLEMLESEVELLEMPPKPSFVPSELQAVHHVNVNVNISQAAQLTMSLDART